MADVGLGGLVAVSAAVAATRSRNTKLDHLAGLLRPLDDTLLVVVVSWLSGRLPQGKIGVGYRTLSGLGVQPVTTTGLGLAEVDHAFDELAAVSGKGSAKRREALLRALLGRATEEEQRFLCLLMVGETRQGALAGMMARAIAVAHDLEPALVQRAVMFSGSLPEVAAAAREGTEALAAFGLELFRPIQPMLASVAHTPADALDGLDEAWLDRKLDGARIQVHRQGERVAVYSRNLREVTASVPEVVELIRGLGTDPLVLDGEVIALRPDGRPHAFQDTMRRFGRRSAALRDRLPLTPFFFDVLQAGERVLVDDVLSVRMDALDASVPSQNRVPRCVASDLAAVEGFFAAALEDGHEGVMAKDPSSRSLAGHRGKGWRKLKSAHTVDLVILAAEWGSGRRKGWLSNLHLGAGSSDGPVMVGKTFKGLTDAMLAAQTEALLGLAVSQDEWLVAVRPELVVEIAFNEVQRSPRYPGGVALRFARVKRHRNDKSVADIDSLESLVALSPAVLFPDS
jgi:DNA ligase 1